MRFLRNLVFHALYLPLRFVLTLVMILGRVVLPFSILGLFIPFMPKVAAGMGWVALAMFVGSLAVTLASSGIRDWLDETGRLWFVDGISPRQQAEMDAYALRLDRWAEKQ